MIIAFVLLAWIAPQQTAPSQTSTLSELADTVLLALAQAGLARDALQRVSVRGNPLVDSFETMTARHSAIKRIENAAAMLEPFAADKDERVRDVAKGLDTVFAALVGAWKDGNKLDEEMLKATNAAQVKALVPKAAEQASAADEAWRMLPLAVTMLPHALVDDNRLIQGKIGYLRITSAERKHIIEEIGRLFPTAKPGAGHAVEVSASLLREWLQGKWKSADDRMP